MNFLQAYELVQLRLLFVGCVSAFDARVVLESISDRNSFRLVDSDQGQYYQLEQIAKL